MRKPPRRMPAVTGLAVALPPHNGAQAAAAIGSLSDAELDQAAPVSLYAGRPADLPVSSSKIMPCATLSPPGAERAAVA